MIATLLLALAQPVTGPDLPAGANSTFQEACLAVQVALGKGDFAGANARLKALPTLETTMEWDESTIPKERREEFARARDTSLEIWRRMVPDLKVKFGKPGRIKISFVPELPPNADSPGPAGATFFYSTDPSEPAVEGVLSLTRTEKRTKIEAKEVTNEVSYAIGAYLGLERMPNVGAIMGRHEQPYLHINLAGPSEAFQVKELQKVVATLRDYAQRKVRVTPARAEVFLSQTEFRPNPTIQGEPLTMSLTVTNRGTGTLRYRLVPDCSCFALAYDKTVKPGESKLVQIAVDTINFTGQLDKRIAVHSNDVDASLRWLTFSMRVDPLYRFLGIARSDVVLIEEKAEGELFFVPNPDKALVPTRVAVEGVTGTATFEPWSGSLPDEPGATPKPMKGYKIRYKLGDNIPPGRAAVGISVATEDPAWSPVKHSFYVQKGIVALPLSIYMGEVGKEPSRAWALVSRPGKPFKITKVESDNPLFTTEIEDLGKNWEYKVFIIYKGGGDFGDLSTTIRISTDDPAQPVLSVPVAAVVKG